ncbi:uncharacterized protein [Oscarella lobularis]|uniref:uncharacterized protein n=1 Tax=Oscarella lobularis TaxID=121494 RepID=UPI003314375E
MDESSLIDWVFAHDPFLVFALGFIIVHEITFVGGSLFLAAIDYFDLSPESKIQKGKHPDKETIGFWNCLGLLALNHLVFQPLMLPLTYKIAVLRGMKMNLPLPSVLEVITHVAACLFINEALFYWGHRALHHPLLYRRFHKIHHHFHVPVAFSAEYVHPVDNLITTAIPLAAGPLLLGSHMFTFWIITVIRLAEGLDGHSGHDFWWSPFRYFPFRPSAAVHDFHHSANSGNYGGLLLLWDWLCGTDAAYKKFLAKQKTN